MSANKRLPSCAPSCTTGRHPHDEWRWVDSRPGWLMLVPPCKAALAPRSTEQLDEDKAWVTP